MANIKCILKDKKGFIAEFKTKYFIPTIRIPAENNLIKNDYVEFCFKEWIKKDKVALYEEVKEELK